MSEIERVVWKYYPVGEKAWAATDYPAHYTDMDVLADIDDDKQGRDAWVIERTDMTLADLESLPDFGGW